MRILLVTTRLETIRSFAEALSADSQVHLDRASSGAEALNAVRASSPDLVVIDWKLPDTEPLGLVSELLMENAMVNTAVISRLSEEEFHEAAEGLGVLARLPVEPDTDDAAELLDRLRKVIGPIR